MRLAPRTLRDGLVVGLIAYAAVAVFYSAFDFLAARGALFTVDMLGKAVFRGLRDPGVLLFPNELDPVAIFWYNLLHLVLSLTLGLVVTAIVDVADRRPERTRLVVLALVFLGALAIAVVGRLTEPMRPVLPWWSIVVANALAAVTAGVYLLRRRPGLWRGVGPAAHGGAQQHA